MKGYICAILLLICGGMAYSATVRDGYCLFGNGLVSRGIHTTTPCMSLVCEPNGEITMTDCPLVACSPGKKVIGMTPERSDKSFPDCCPQPICKSRHEQEMEQKISGVPYYLPQIEFE
ncbi:uncharacterized protein LOC143900949 [Temnothorax americanus]|uniref:uncharacterized protein LOC143900949 n=1 Tax=Temnothorax americanus TaxID=1964332 RepID=UPI0040692E11